MSWEEFVKFAEKLGGIPIDPANPEDEDDGVEGDVEVWIVMKGENQDDSVRAEPRDDERRNSP